MANSSQLQEVEAPQDAGGVVYATVDVVVIRHIGFITGFILTYYWFSNQNLKLKYGCIESVYLKCIQIKIENVYVKGIQIKRVT